jgi:hypothetical protein
MYTQSHTINVIPPLHECMMKNPSKTHVTIIDRPLHTPCLVSIPPQYTKPCSIASEGCHMFSLYVHVHCLPCLRSGSLSERTAHILGHGKPNLNGPKILGLGVKSRLDCQAGPDLGFKFMWFREEAQPGGLLDFLLGIGWANFCSCGLSWPSPKLEHARGMHRSATWLYAIVRLCPYHIVAHVFQLMTLSSWERPCESSFVPWFSASTRVNVVGLTRAPLL